jgi:uncharacterized protein
VTREDAIREVVRRLVDYYQPEKIYLIGSSARGEARPDSDLDFVVVVPDDTPRGRLTSGEVHERMRGIGMGVDIVPFTRSGFIQRSDWLMSLPAIALREGILEYDAAEPARRG